MLRCLDEWKKHCNSVASLCVFNSFLTLRNHFFWLIKRRRTTIISSPHGVLLNCKFQIYCPFELFAHMKYFPMQEERHGRVGSNPTLTSWVQDQQRRNPGKILSLVVVNLEKYFKWERANTIFSHFLDKELLDSKKKKDRQRELYWSSISSWHWRADSLKEAHSTCCVFCQVSSFA